MKNEFGRNTWGRKGVDSTTEQDVITLRQASKSKIIVTSRKLDDEWERYEEEGSKAPEVG